MEGMTDLLNNFLERFAQYLEQSGIVPQYTMPSIVSVNGIAEPQNMTFQDMVNYGQEENLV